MKTKNIKCIIIIIFAVSAFITALIIWGNKSIVVNRIDINRSDIPEQFDGFTVVQISDLHNEEFGKGNKYLLDKIRTANPDIIVITGDLIDSRHTNIEVGIDFVINAQMIAPVYYVNGNHESRLSIYKKFEKNLIDAGVIILNNNLTEIKKNNETIKITGISDPDFCLSDNKKNATDSLLSHLQSLEPHNGFNILLTHRPEFFDIYVKNKYNLVFAGHAHGGQFRIPFIGGIYAPGQGFFPKYDSGLYLKNDTSMIVSRGLGNSLFPFRINNRPEITVAKLNKTEVQL